VLLYLLVGVVYKSQAAVVAFVILAIPSILAGAYAGFEAIDRSVVSAARAVGMTPWQVLWKVEVPSGCPAHRRHPLRHPAGRRDGHDRDVRRPRRPRLLHHPGHPAARHRADPRRLDPGRRARSAPRRPLRTRPARPRAARRPRPHGAPHGRGRRPGPSLCPLDPAPHSIQKGTHHVSHHLAPRPRGDALTITALALTACGSSGSLTAPEETSSGSAGASDTITIGSQAYYSNEIIAEIYAQALEGAGFTVERTFNIGQRDAIIPSLQDGTIQLTPSTPATSCSTSTRRRPRRRPTTCTRRSRSAARRPRGARPVPRDRPGLVQRDGGVRGAAQPEEHRRPRRISPLVLGGAPELEQRPYGPSGLKEKYGVDVTFSATADTTVDELVAGNIQVANVYSADPNIKTKDLVTWKTRRVSSSRRTSSRS
jgi:osmoprotectant transport system substrate-binding protein